MVLALETCPVCFDHKPHVLLESCVEVAVQNLPVFTEAYHNAQHTSCCRSSGCQGALFTVLTVGLVMEQGTQPSEHDCWLLAALLSNASALCQLHSCNTTGSTTSPRPKVLTPTNPRQKIMHISLRMGTEPLYGTENTIYSHIQLRVRCCKTVVMIQMQQTHNFCLAVGWIDASAFAATLVWPMMLRTGVGRRASGSRPR